MSGLNGITLTDGSGRQLRLRELAVLEESRIVRILGNDAGNTIYMNGYVIPALAVASIDGDEQPLPASLREIEAAITTVGSAGIKAVLQQMIARSEADEEGRDAVKNS